MVLSVFVYPMDVANYTVVMAYLLPAAAASEFFSRFGTSCWTNPSVMNSFDTTAGTIGNTADAAEKAMISSSFVPFATLVPMY